MSAPNSTPRRRAKGSWKLKPAICAIKALELKAGDCVVMETKWMSVHAARHAQEQFAEQLPGVKLLICQDMIVAGILRHPLPEGEKA